MNQLLHIFENHLDSCKKKVNNFKYRNLSEAEIYNKEWLLGYLNRVDITVNDFKKSNQTNNDVCTTNNLYNCNDPAYLNGVYNGIMLCLTQDTSLLPIYRNPYYKMNFFGKLINKMFRRSNDKDILDALQMDYFKYYDKKLLWNL